jgi:hypothetical protein
MGSTRLGPVGENYSISPAGSARDPFSGVSAATIIPIAGTGATLTLGHESAKEKTALTAELRRYNPF